MLIDIAFCVKWLRSCSRRVQVMESTGFSFGFLRLWCFRSYVFSWTAILQPVEVVHRSPLHSTQTSAETIRCSKPSLFRYVHDDSLHRAAGLFSSIERRLDCLPIGCRFVFTLVASLNPYRHRWSYQDMDLLTTLHSGSLRPANSSTTRRYLHKNSISNV